MCIIYMYTVHHLFFFLQFEISVSSQPLPAAYLVCFYLSFQEAARNGARVACLDFVKPTPQGTAWGEDKSILKKIILSSFCQVKFCLITLKD